MKYNKWVYLLSCGETREPPHLPMGLSCPQNTLEPKFMHSSQLDVTGLQDDPYRSLARAVRGKRKGWKKTRIPFTEFLWADFLRSYSASFAMLAEGEHVEDKENRAVYDFAIQLCRSDAAMLLPGYIGLLHSASGRPLRGTALNSALSECM